MCRYGNEKEQNKSNIEQDSHSEQWIEWHNSDEQCIFYSSWLWLWSIDSSFVCENRYNPVSYKIYSDGNQYCHFKCISTSFFAVFFLSVCCCFWRFILNARILFTPLSNRIIVIPRSQTKINLYELSFEYILLICGMYCSSLRRSRSIQIHSNVEFILHQHLHSHRAI